MTCEKRGEVGEVVYKKPSAGGVAEGAFGELSADGVDENGVCDDYGLPGHEYCIEWNSVRMVKAESFDEAREAAERGEFTGTATSVSACEMKFDGEPPTDRAFLTPSLQKAKERALQALDELRKTGEAVEPARSAALRSAAELAAACGDWREAKDLALEELTKERGGDAETRRALRKILEKANREIGMTTVYIGFQDWNRGGLHEEYSKVEVPELNETAVKDAAAELVENGYGYFYSVDMMSDEEKENAGDESTASERYWVHAQTCPEAAEAYNDWRDVCDCDLNKRFSGEVDVKVMEAN